MYKKCAGFFLFLSFQSYCMMRVNQLPIKTLFSKKVLAHKNDAYNKLFFQNKMILDVQPVVMSHLDHRSNVQFIRTSKRLYEKYVQQTENGKIYHSCLFTKHPFRFSPKIDFNVYFDCYNRALFHYAPRQEAQTEILLLMEDKVIQDASVEMLQKFEINHSTGAIMNFYKQQFTYVQFSILINAPDFLQAMLKRGVSPNAQCDNKSLIYDTVFSKREKVLEVLLADSRLDPNMQNNDGDTVLHEAVWYHNIKIVKRLLADSRVDPNIQNRNGNTALHKAILLLLSTEMINALLDNSIDPNIQDNNGDTVLHSMSEVITLLLAHSKLDLDIKNKQGHTALTIAKACDNISIVKMLSAHNRK